MDPSMDPSMVPYMVPTIVPQIVPQMCPSIALQMDLPLMNPSTGPEPLRSANNSTLSQFDAELLLASIANNDSIIQNYHEKCIEVERLQADIQSITDSANQVRQMYENEKLHKNRLHTENMEMRHKIEQLESRLVAINNERVNLKSVHDQTVADSNAKRKEENQKYIDLCRIIVDQGNILQLNKLSTAQLTRKCTMARETLEVNGFKCEKVKSPKKKQDPNRIKSRTMCTMTEPMPDPTSSIAPIQPDFAAIRSMPTCERSTQYQQSKATRSTCTSSFISFADACTTMEDPESQNYFNPTPDVNVLRENVDSYPMLLPPISDQIISTKMAQSTQTHRKEYFSRETLTIINNVRKPIDYVRVDSPVGGGMWPEKVKKEDISSAFGSMSNLCWTCLANHPDLSSRDAGTQLNPSLSHLWQLMGHVIFTMIDQRNNFGAGNQASSIQRMQHQLQNMIDEHVKGADDVPDVTMKDASNDGSNDAMDLDEHSRDSIESYSSGKVVISKVRDSSEVLSECQTESTEGNKTNGATLNTADRRSKNVTGPTIKSNKNLAESLSAQSPLRISVRNVASGSETIFIEQSFMNGSTAPSIASSTSQNVVTSNKIVPHGELSGISNSIVNDFKVPKRKSSSSAVISNAKKRKSAKSAANEKLLMSSIFGEDFEDIPPETGEHEEFRQILDLYRALPPPIVSPIKDLDPELVNTESLTKQPENLLPESNEELKQTAPIKDIDPELVNPDGSIEQSEILRNDFNKGLERREPIKDLNPEPINPEISSKKLEDSIIIPMHDSNEVPIFDSITNLNEKEMTNTIEESTVNMDVMAIEEPANDSIEWPAINLNVNPTSDTMKQPNDFTSTTSVKDTIDIIPMDQNKASYGDQSLSSISSDGTFGEISPDKINHSSESSNNEPEIYYYSPASPQRENYTKIEPSVIPSKTLYLNQTAEESNETKYDASESEINRIIQNYSAQFAKIVATSSVSTLSNEDSYLMASLRNAIERYCMSSEWTSDTITECLNRMLLRTRNVKYLAIALLEVVEDTKEVPSLEFTPPSPALPPSIQRCLVLYSRLAHNISTFRAYFKVVLERKIFAFSNEQSVEALSNLTHLYIAIDDIDAASSPANMRLFIYKCLYYFTFKCIPMVFHVLMAHPFVLPHANSVEFLNDPLSKAIVSALTSITYSTDIKDKSYKKTEMFLTLKSRFGYFADKVFPIDGTIDYCIDAIQNNRLTNVEYAIILLAKRQGYEYAIKNIVQKYLIPLLHRYFTNDLTTNSQNDQQIATILFVIASIVKTVPIDEPIDDYVNLLAIALNATDRQIIQEAAISGLCQLSRFGTKRIYQLISAWKPNYIKSKRITAILNTIVYKKPINFWFSKSP